MENQPKTQLMKKLLDWQQPDVVNVFDEVTLWSAPFGRLLLENIPMQPQATVLDIGFGTGFPLMELSQRFGDGSRIIGIDIWDAAVDRAREKTRMFELSNIEILQQSASSIDLPETSVDLVTSNLGINNFDDKESVYTEVFRVLRPGGRLCITTNPVGTFEELFELFHRVLISMDLPDTIPVLQEHIAHRNTPQQITAEITAQGFQFVQAKTDQTSISFVDAAAVLNHSLIRIGFRETWESWFTEPRRTEFFQQVLKLLQTTIDETGVFHMAIPMLYLEFTRPGD